MRAATTPAMPRAAPTSAGIPDAEFRVDRPESANRVPIPSVSGQPAVAASTTDTRVFDRLWRVRNAARGGR